MLGVGAVANAPAGAPKRQFAGTMLGMPSPTGGAPAPQPAPTPAPPVAGAGAGRPKGNLLAATMVGVMQPPPAAPAPAQAKKGGLAQTMVDVAPANQSGGYPPVPGGTANQSGGYPPVPGGTANQSGAYPPVPPAPVMPIAGAPVAMVGAQADAGPKRGLAQTVVGLAAPAAQGQPAQPLNRNVAKSTILGVALPGIAPTHGPNDPPSAPQAAAPQYGAPPPIEAYVPQAAFAPPQFVAPPPPEAPVVPDVAPVRRSRAPAVVLLLVARIGHAATVVYVVFMRPKPAPAMSGELAGEADAPQLVVACGECGAGSELTLGGKSAPFTQGKATLAIDPSETTVGSHEFKGTVKVGDGKPQPFTLQVLVPFSVAPSLAPLAKGKGAVDVDVTVAPEVTSVTIDGKEAKIDGGHATRAIAIPAPDGDARSFEKAVEYAVVWKGGERKGSIKLVVPYASLKLALPGRRPIAIGAEELDVTGRATPGATVRIGAGDDAPTVVADKDGAFKARAKIGASDEKLQLLAYSAKAAPRALSVSIVHAESKAAAEKAMRAEAKDAAAAVAAPASHVDEVVVLKADVVNVFEEDGRAGFRGDVHGKDAASGDEGIGAPVRVLLPSGVTVQKGDVVEIVGVVTRAAPLASGKGTAAEIDASFVVAKR
jgi:hypothetical protein